MQAVVVEVASLIGDDRLAPSAGRQGPADLYQHRSPDGLVAVEGRTRAAIKAELARQVDTGD